MPTQGSAEPATQDNKPLATVPPLPAPLLLPRNRPAVLATTPNLVGLLQALRRRWLLAFVLGSIGAGTVVGIMFAFMKTTYTGRTVLHVSSTQPYVVSPDPRASVDFHNYQRTQIGFIKSRLVLNSALRDPKVQGLETVKQKLDPVAWLEKEIMVDFNTGPEFLRIAMNGEDKDELVAIVDAVREAYLKDIVNKEPKERMERVKKLKEHHATYEKRLQKKNEEIDVIVKLNTGSGDPKTLEITFQLLLNQIYHIQTHLLKVQSELVTAKIDVERAEGKAKGEINISDLLIEAELLQRKDFAALLKDMQDDEIKLRALEFARPDLIKSKDAMYLQKVKELADKQTKLAKEREKLLPAVTKDVQEKLIKQAKNSAEGYARQVDLLTRYEKALKKELAEQKKALEEFKVNKLDVESLKREMAKDEVMYKKLGDQISALEIELKADDRTTVIEPAVAIKDTDSRIRMLGLGGGGVFALIVFAVALFEFRQRRVNTVDEVIRGLDLRLMGTLPTLPSKTRRRTSKPADPSEPYWENLLAESVDAVRTMLLHAARLQSHQVVMVSSAVGGEGKSLLSSHLAVSLARAGYRTLLVDCDLRRPSVHRLFQIEQSPGCSEILRGEIDAFAAAQEGPVDGLWLVPAGVADADAFQAMAQHRFKEIFQGLKSKFDFILVDSAPILPVADSLLIAQCVDSVVFSILRDVSRLPTVYAAYESLAALRVPVLGAVVNGAQGDHYHTRYA